jgi:hypothetical protein
MSGLPESGPPIWRWMDCRVAIMSVQFFSAWGAGAGGAHICQAPVPTAGWFPAQPVSSVARLGIDYLKSMTARLGIDYLKSMTLQGAQFLFCFDYIGLGQCLW